MDGKISLLHGDGGKYTQELIKNIFYMHFDNEYLNQNLDAAIFNVNGNRIAFTTDTFVVKPAFFAGGNIGKLSVCGTINDLACVFARPLYLSAGFIIEEGFEIEKLNSIAASMAEICHCTGVKIVAGDTKVVEKGSADGIYINTAGIGILMGNYMPSDLEAGDEIIITGTIGEHGTVIAIERYGLSVKGDFRSDCQPLNSINEILYENAANIKLMRDPTRGGLATVLNEVSEKYGVGITVYEQNIPVRDEVNAVSEILGIDPLYLACEGRMVLFAKGGTGEIIAENLRKTGYDKACIIGKVVDEFRGKVCMVNGFCGRRMLPLLENPMLPRIC